VSTFSLFVASGTEKQSFRFARAANGITFTFSEKEWTAVRTLFRRAWQMPEVRLAWDALTLEYGEL